MTALLEGKIALVTGAGRGLGRGTALALAKHGADVAVIDRDADTAEAVRAEIVALGVRAVAIGCDVSIRSDVEAATARVIDALGSLDILVNNAQTANHVPISFEDHSDHDIQVTYATGLGGTIYFMQACFPHLKTKGGVIVNFGSAAGVEGHTGMLGYAAAKEGIRGVTRVAAHEWGQFAIRVNTILPFGMSEICHIYAAANPERFASQLEKVPLRRAGDPELDVGNAVVALSSDLMRWVTGATIPVDGGMCIVS